jgi:hypothetical protein
VLAGVALVGLVVATIWASVATASNRSRADELRKHGVPVRATVTSCVGISSGIGMGIEYYQCRATYALAGSSFESELHGDRSLLATGRIVDAVAVPGDPGSLSLAGRAPRSSGGSWTAAVVLGALSLALALGMVALYRRGRSAGRGEDGGPVLVDGGEPVVDGGQSRDLR